uniref:Uncharacterized protein n=1 Tax=Meloidogyne enterolobii TaxID=390850 RepID=A0A6V7TV89_MELEN|nr:unnamed protein product [Meloidogyne enterolobii]
MMTNLKKSRLNNKKIMINSFSKSIVFIKIISKYCFIKITRFTRTRTRPEKLNSNSGFSNSDYSSSVFFQLLGTRLTLVIT